MSSIFLLIGMRDTDQEKRKSKPQISLPSFQFFPLPLLRFFYIDSSARSKHYLRYLPILAKLTVDITTCGCDRESIGFRKKVEEGFFFYGVDVDSTSLSVDQGAVISPYVFSHTTIPSLFISKLALARAKGAFYFPVWMLFVVTGFNFRKICFSP